MKHTTLKLALVTLLGAMAFSTQAQNAYLENLSMPRYIKAGTNYPIQVNAKNLSSVPLPSFSVRWRLDGGAWNNGTTLTITPPGLSNGGYYIAITHPIQLNTTQGVHTLDVEILSTNDSDPGNNVLSMSFTALNAWADKVVLMEGRTETWCPQCPTANTVTNTLMTDPDYAVAKFHTSDGFAFTDGTSYYNTYYNPGFTPAGVVDMGEYGDYAVNYASNQWGDEMEARAAGVAPASISMNSTLNHATRTLTVSVTATFTYAFTGPFKLNVYLLEDAVPGPQANAPSGYLHNGVVRALLGGATGTGGLIPNTPVVGTPYIKTYTYTVPATFKLGDLKLIGVLEHAISNTNRYCVNAAKGEASPVGIAELADMSDRLEVYPNPFHDAVNITLKGTTGPARAELIAPDGRLLVQRDLMLDQAGAVRLELGSDLPSSVYVLRIVTNEGVAQQQLLHVK
ncbi:MAG: Omp28-related outer membrane protein [Flavobacteriales bacterium]|jgi:hypothetical protein|nr:Omp28-related outer membrane protein [Flavobacteriales bacterium]